MSCCSRFSRIYYDLSSIIIQVFPALSSESFGSITCTPSKDTSYEWSDMNEEAELSENGDQVNSVRPGTYSLLAHLPEGDIEIQVRMNHMTYPIVTRYTVTHATTDNSRDGHIIAHIENAPENARFLWTNGIITNTPELEDVRTGWYSVTLLPSEKSEEDAEEENEEENIFIQKSGPVFVGIKKFLQMIEE